MVAQVFVLPSSQGCKNQYKLQETNLIKACGLSIMTIKGDGVLRRDKADAKVKVFPPQLGKELRSVLAYL